MLDIGERDVLCSTLSPAFLRQQYTGTPERRRESADITAGLVRLADGYFALILSRPHFWQNAMRILGLDDLAEIPELQSAASRAERKEQWAQRVQQAMLGWKRKDLFDALAARRVIAGRRWTWPTWSKPAAGGAQSSSAHRKRPQAARPSRGRRSGTAAPAGA